MTNIIIAVISGIFSGIAAALITGWITYKISMRQLKQQETLQCKSMIFPEHMQWLSKMRNILCDIIESAYDLGNKCLDQYTTDREIADAISTIRNHANLAVLMISPNNASFKKKVDEFVANIEEKSNKKYLVSHNQKPYGEKDIEIQSLIIEFRLSCQCLLKEQWDEISKDIQ